MKRHKIIHTRDKPFTCEECSYSVSRKYELSRHKETKHSNQTDEKLFQCDSAHVIGDGEVLVNLKYISAFILERNHSNVLFVIKDSLLWDI